MKKIIQYLRENAVSYEELGQLPDDACVKVSRSYFYSLMAKQGLIKKESSQLSAIFFKYIEIERMQEFLRGIRGIHRYFLMPVYEIRYVMNILEDVPSSITFLLKSDMKVSDLEQCYMILKEQSRQLSSPLTGEMITKEAVAIKVKSNY